MADFSTPHIVLFCATAAFIALTMWAVSKMNRTWQNVMFILGALACAGGIFFRYGMGLSWEGGITLKTLGTQLLQVCNFNIVLVVLMLVPRFELARQYSIFFSMFAASTTLVSIPNSWASLNWYDTTVLNSWFNHAFAIALPLWMLAARRLKPKREYVLKVTACVVGYFLISAAVTTLLIKLEVIPSGSSYSFIFDTEGIPVFETLYKLIPVPCFYLLPLVPVMAGFFSLLVVAFKRYEVKPYGKKI